MCVCVLICGLPVCFKDNPTQRNGPPFTAKRHFLPSLPFPPFPSLPSLILHSFFPSPFLPRHPVRGNIFSNVKKKETAEIWSAVFSGDQSGVARRMKFGSTQLRVRGSAAAWQRGWLAEVECGNVDDSGEILVRPCSIIGRPLPGRQRCI